MYNRRRKKKEVIGKIIIRRKLKELNCQVADSIHLAKNRVQCRVLVKTIKKFKVRENINFFSRSTRRTFPHGATQLAPSFLMVYYTSATISRKRMR
jgi:hypothetical protein